MGAANSSRVVLAFGDSLTEGYARWGTIMHPYTLTLEKSLVALDNSIKVVNAGVSGETTDEMVPRFTQLFNAQEFGVAIILGGTNDLGGKNPDNVFNNLKTMHELAAKKGCKTYAVTIPELAAEEHETWVYPIRSKINNMLKEYCAKRKIQVIDLAAAIPYSTLTEEERKDLWDDGLHFTPKGYDKFGEIVFNAIRNDL